MESDVEEALLSLAHIPASWLEGYEWPPEIRDRVTHASGEVTFDRKQLMAYVSAARASYFAVPFLTSEYADLGILWADYASRAGVAFAIAAGDERTVDMLAQRAIPHFRTHLPGSLAAMRRYSNRAGFNGKALAVIFARYHVIRFLLESGYGAISCDIDALLLRNPEPALRGADIAFQRVAYFPKIMALRWGFSACGGFVACAPSATTLRILRRVIALQRYVSSDQLAWNLALFESPVSWEAASSYSHPEDLIAGFARNADRSFVGFVAGLDLSVRALPATSFWRHNFVPLDLPRAILVHPNSPKSLAGKLEILKRTIGNWNWPSDLTVP